MVQSGSAPAENGFYRSIDRDRNLLSGISAVNLIATRLGVQINENDLRKNTHGISRGSSIHEMMLHATSLGLRAHGLRPGWKGLIRLRKSLPAIVVLKNGEAMILNKADDTLACRCVSLQDPLANASIHLQLKRRAFAAIWTGEVVLLQRERVETGHIQPFNFRMIVGLIGLEHGMLRDISISALMLSLLALTPILFFRIISERVLPYHAISTFAVISIIAAVLIAFETIFGALRRHILLRLTTRIDVKLATDMFIRVINLPVDYFERTPAGLTLHKMGQLGRVRTFLIGQLFGTLLDAGILLFFVPLMFFISPVLTGVVLVFATLICGWIVLMLPAFRARSSAVESAEAQRGAFLTQSIQGIRTVKSLALESRQISEWDVLTAKLARLRLKEGDVGNIIQSIVAPLEKLIVTGSFGVGAYLALMSSDPAGVATLFTFMLLSQRLAAPLIQASQLVNQYDEARTAIGVVGSLVNQPAEEGRSGEGVRNELRGHIAFAGVLFKYDGALKPALNKVTFEVSQGTTLGVMGRSGSGKTTITRLLQRLNTEYSGLVKVDGIDVRNYDLTHFRSSLGVVLQENFLFSGTIRFNIAIAKPEATFDEIVQAARLAGAEEFIDKLPAGYETYIYEGSPNLSGGQRQRLAIARALITDPKILILDEATSALDAESEAIVNANIERISQGRTVITISHRLASLVKADAILVMEQGEVNDIGKHHELLERNEIYANLWYTQNPHTAAPAAPRAQLTYRGPQSVA